MKQAVGASTSVSDGRTGDGEIAKGKMWVKEALNIP